MSKWLRKDKARACPIHTAVLNKAAERLSEAGTFAKEDVLDDLNFGAVADAIRWDYIREFIEEEQGCDLVPLSEAYFTRHARRDEIGNPAKFIASGHGKKTFGYAAVIEENDHLVVATVRIRKRMANGVGKAFVNYLQAIEAKRGNEITFEEPHQIEAA
jgi:hypothetical protein